MINPSREEKLSRFHRLSKREGIKTGSEFALECCLHSKSRIHRRRSRSKNSRSSCLSQAQQTSAATRVNVVTALGTLAEKLREAPAEHDLEILIDTLIKSDTSQSFFSLDRQSQ
jgi:hypothetical protein